MMVNWKGYRRKQRDVVEGIVQKFCVGLRKNVETSNRIVSEMTPLGKKAEA
jgi:hypothetical protein